MCIVEGIKALSKKNRRLSDLVDENKKVEIEQYMSKPDWMKLKNSLDTFNNYDKSVARGSWSCDPPTYDEYKIFLISIKPELESYENLIKLWFVMFEQSRYTTAGFNIHDWKLQTKVIMEQLIGEQLNNYINFYNHKTDESGTNKIQDTQ